MDLALLVHRLEFCNRKDIHPAHIVGVSVLIERGLKPIRGA
jgi:hypothetical protein